MLVYVQCILVSVYVTPSPSMIQSPELGSESTLEGCSYTCHDSTLSSVARSQSIAGDAELNSCGACMATPQSSLLSSSSPLSSPEMSMDDVVSKVSLSSASVSTGSRLGQLLALKNGCTF